MEAPLFSGKRLVSMNLQTVGSDRKTDNQFQFRHKHYSDFTQALGENIIGFTYRKRI